MADLAAELGAAAFRLRAAGDGLERELTKAIKDAVGEVPAAIRAGLVPHLPDSYADELAAGLTIRVSARTAGDEPKVTVSAVSDRDRKLRHLDAGQLTHPLFGRFPRYDPRDRWFTQEVQPGWFTGPCEDAGPQVREAIERALHDVSEQAVKR